MNSERSVKWEPVPGIVGPCADISLKCGPGYEAIATMHFSWVVHTPPKDLQISFRPLIALLWEDEFAENQVVPRPLPGCDDERWLGWTFPLLIVEDSMWLASYGARGATVNELKHYALISMVGTVQLLAFKVEAEWVDGVDS